MTQSLVDKIAAAVLYEGYVLYPYRPSSVKNQHRWTFGVLYPRPYAESRPAAGSDAWITQTQCLAQLVPNHDGPAAILRVAVRFLHLTTRTASRLLPAGSADPDEQGRHPWQEAVERSIELPAIPLGSLVTHPYHHEFSFAPCELNEPFRDHAGQTVGVLTRTQHQIAGAIDLFATSLAPDLVRITLRTSNLTAIPGSVSRDAALLHSLVSAHSVLALTPGGRFVSLTDPPDALRPHAEACQNIGSWPVLVGHPGQTDTLLASPIILPDYPQVAPESPGDLFDATEIDEILTLRILTLTDDEKRQAEAADLRVHALLARTQGLARDQLMTLHGALRNPHPYHPEVPHA